MALEQKNHPEPPTSAYSLLFGHRDIVIGVILGIALFVVFQLWHRDTMSKSSAAVKNEAKLVKDFQQITGASANDSTKFIKRHRTLEAALGAFFDDPTAQAAAASKGDKAREKKLGDVWEKFKDPSDSKLIRIEGTMELCEELEIDPASDPVLFCLALDLGSKVTGEWEKGPWVAGWLTMNNGTVDSLEGMKNALPGLRKKLKTDPVYFKKVYMHTFDLAKPPQARTLPLETALDLWRVYIPPALEASPSALSRVSPGHPPTSSSSSNPPSFTLAHFEKWIDFQTKKGKAISKDTWSLFIDFVRTIDGDFKEYDEAAAWPSTIDDFVDYVRGSA